MRNMYPLFSNLIDQNPFIDIKSYLEIGVREGDSLLRVIEQFPSLGRIVLCDTWGGEYGGSMRGNHEHIISLLETHKYPLDKVTFLDGDSKVKIPEYFAQNSSVIFDFAYIDGDHSGNGLWSDLLNIAHHANIILVGDLRHIQHSYLRDVFRAFHETVRDIFIAIDDGHDFGILLRGETIGV